MKAIVLLGVATLLVVGGPNANDDKWFDMENCAICKQMVDHQELMMEMKWEAHPTQNGMIMVATIPEQHKATVKEAHEKMLKTIARLEQGEPLELCGFCKSYGGLRAAGATIEEIETSTGQITLVTSNDPDVVEQIHKHCKRSMEEQEKMMAQLQGEK